MRHILSLYIFLVSFTNVNAQQVNASFIFQDSSYLHYNQFIDSAKSLSQDFPERSLMLFDSAFQIKNTVFIDYYLAFALAEKIGMIENAHSYLREGTQNSGLILEDFKVLDKEQFLLTKYGQQYLQERDSLLFKHWQKIDTIYYRELEELFLLDQSNRSNPSIFKEIDRNNFERLNYLSQNKGFPTYTSTGKGLHFAEAILWHHRDSFPSSKLWQQILPLIRKQIEIGELDPTFLNPYYIR